MQSGCCNWETLKAKSIRLGWINEDFIKGSKCICWLRLQVSVLLICKLLKQMNAPYSHVGWREWKRRKQRAGWKCTERQMGWPDIFVHIMCALVLRPHPHPPPPPDLCHDSGFSLIECGKKKKAGHVLARGQSQSAPRGQSLSQPCKFMTAWQLLLWNEACVLWCVTPVRQVKRWNPVHFIGNSTPGVKKAELVNALCVPLPRSLKPLFAS